MLPPCVTLAQPPCGCAGKKLFTPGPLCCSREVKEAMMLDLGSRDKEFIACVQEIRDELLRVAGVSECPAEGFWLGTSFFAVYSRV